MDIQRLHKLVDDASVKVFSDSKQRYHLGASTLGGCQRAAWFSFRWVFNNHSHSGRMMRLFNRGHIEEPRLEKILEAAGIKRHILFDEETGKPRQWKVIGYKGHLSGSLDDVVSGLPGAEKDASGNLIYYLCEKKTHNDKNFKKLKKEGVPHAFPKHYCQIQTYMAMAGLKSCLYIGVNKNDDEIYLEEIHHSALVSDLFLEKARVIIDASPIDGLPGISNKASYWECKFCDFHENCYGNRAPEKRCRTCVWCTAEPEEKWHCGKNRDEVKQSRGTAHCEEWLPGPGFMPGRDIRLDGNRLIEHRTDGEVREYTAPIEPSDFE